MLRWSVMVLTALSAALILAGFLGALHPALDTLSLLRPILAVLYLLGLAAPAGARHGRPVAPTLA